VKKIVITIFFLCFSITVFSRDGAMNIFSMNIHGFEDNWKFRINHILNHLITQSPDVIALQEVCVDQFTHDSQIDYIKTFLIDHGYKIKKIEAQYTHLAWNRYEEFILLISKQNVSKVSSGLLPKSMLQRGYISFNIKNRWYINTHLEFRNDNFTSREEQIKFLIDKFNNTPYVIMGDFNSSPVDSEQRILHSTNHTPIFPGVTLVDMGDDQRGKIDGFWFSQNYYADINRLSAETLFKKKIDGMYLSDHLAVSLHLIFN